MDKNIEITRFPRPTFPRLANLLGLLLAVASLLPAQRREDLLSIQRDVAQLQDQLKQVQASQDAKLGTLENLLKQALEEQARLATTLGALERTLGERINQQQARIEGPVVAVGGKVDTLADEVRVVRENMGSINTRVGSLDNKLADISSAVRMLSAAAAAAPPPPANPVTATQPPAGVTAEGLYQNAFRDYSSGKDELAMSEFTEYLKYFSTSENAPTAQFYIAQIYDRAKQYEDAAQAFDAVLERYPESPKASDALYMKGVEYMKANRKADAIAVLREFLDSYPNHNSAGMARTHLRTLGASATGVPSATPRNRKK